jgi:hypothetical protein
MLNRVLSTKWQRSKFIFGTNYESQQSRHLKIGLQMISNFISSDFVPFLRFDYIVVIFFVLFFISPAQCWKPFIVGHESEEKIRAQTMKSKKEN